MKNFNKAIFPGIQGGPLMHVIAAKAVCFKEALSPDFVAYQEQILKNAKALCNGLLERGVKIVSGGTDNHLMLVDLTGTNVSGKELEKRLDQAHITCNKNTIPNDPRSPFVTSGVRLGTPAVTSRGMKEQEMDLIAEMIAMVIRDEKNVENAEIVREKGTNRSKFFRGQVDKYRWIDYGSSYLPSEMNAAYLYAQLEECDKINRKRHQVYDGYHERLADLEAQGKLDRPFVPDGCAHNAHMYYIKVKDLTTRTRLIAYLRENGIAPAFHYVPLHSSPAGEKFGRFCGEDVYTTKESERLARLPMYYGLTLDQVDFICGLIKNFFELEEQ